MIPQSYQGLAAKAGCCTGGDTIIIKLIQKIYEVDPLTCPKCSGKMKVISIDYSHRGVGPYGPEATSQLPASDKWLYIDPEYPEAYTA